MSYVLTTPLNQCRYSTRELAVRELKGIFDTYYDTHNIEWKHEPNSENIEATVSFNGLAYHYTIKRAPRYYVEHVATGEREFFDTREEMIERFFEKFKQYSFDHLICRFVDWSFVDDNTELFPEARDLYITGKE
jgi:hypothetical protein